MTLGTLSEEASAAFHLRLADPGALRWSTDHCLAVGCLGVLSSVFAFLALQPREFIEFSIQFGVWALLLASLALSTFFFRKQPIGIHFNDHICILFNTGRRKRFSYRDLTEFSGFGIVLKQQKFPFVLSDEHSTAICTEIVRITHWLLATKRISPTQLGDTLSRASLRENPRVLMYALATPLGCVLLGYFVIPYWKPYLLEANGELTLMMGATGMLMILGICDIVERSARKIRKLFAARKMPLG